MRLGQVVRVEALACLERGLREVGRAHPVEPVGARPVHRAVPGVHAPHRQLALERVRLHGSGRRSLVALLQVLDLDHHALLRRLGERPDELLLVVTDERGRRLGQLELAEGLLELAAHAVERRVGLGGDRRPDVLDREADRARLERRQLGRTAEDVAVQLLVDAHRARLLVDLRVHRVAAAAEVDEVEQRERVLQLLARDREARRQLVGVELGVPAFAAGREQVREQRLQHAEALRRDRPRRDARRAPRGRSRGARARRTAPRPRASRAAARARRRRARGAPSAPAARRGRSGAGPTPRAARAAHSPSRRRRPRACRRRPGCDAPTRPCRRARRCAPARRSRRSARGAGRGAPRRRSRRGA